MCFTCGGTGDQGCKRRLNAQNFHLQSGEPQCSACFDRLVKAAIQKAAIPLSGRLSIDAASPRPIIGGGGDSLNNSVGSVTGSTSTSGRYINSQPLKSSNKSELPKCKACKQNVYKMEEIAAMDASWHKQCFTCDGCQRMLSVDGYEVKNDTPYCLVCINKVQSSFSSHNDDNNYSGGNHSNGGVAIDQDEEPDPISDKNTNNTNEDDEVLVVVEPFVDDPDVHFDTSESAANSFHNGSSYNSVASINQQQRHLQEAVAGATHVNDDDDDDLEPAKADDDEDKANVDPNNADIVISGRGKNNDDAATAAAVDDIPAATNGDEAEALNEEYTDVEFKGQVYRGYHLSYEYDFDDKGVIFWIGSKNKTEMFMNPHVSGEINVSMSSCYKGKPANVVSRSIEGVPTYTENSLNSWIKIDLGPHRLLLADNSSLTYFRIVQHGPNSNGNNCLFCCGVEFYGVLFEKLDN